MRSSSSITIFRPGRTNLDVPITPGSTREWKLMETDCINLEFNLYPYTSGDFRIGDYVFDEIFGKFIISDIPTPGEYDREADFIKYSLRFDREYIGFKNKAFLFPHLYEDENGIELVRKEAEWSLTDTLESQVRQILLNLFALGYDYSYCIDGTHKYRVDRTNPGVFEHGGGKWRFNGDVLTFATDDRYRFVGNTFQMDEDPLWYLSQTLFLADQNDYTGEDVFTPSPYVNQRILCTYSGANIIQALTDLADAFKCDWWVDGNVICFGKCSFGEELVFTTLARDMEDVNVESMSPTKEEDNYANRLYVFGGTKNVPDTYQKKLVFDRNDTKTADVFTDFFPIEFSRDDTKMGTLSGGTEVSFSPVQGYACTDFIPAALGEKFYVNLSSNDVRAVGLASDKETIVSVLLAASTSVTLSTITINDSAIKYVVFCSETTGMILGHFARIIPTYFRDKSRILAPYMIKGGSFAETVEFSRINQFRYDAGFSIQNEGKYRISGTFSAVVPMQSTAVGYDRIEGNVRIDLSIDGTVIGTQFYEVSTFASPYDFSVPISVDTIQSLSSGAHALSAVITVSLTEGTYSGSTNQKSDIIVASSFVPVDLSIVFNETEYAVRFSPMESAQDWLCFIDEEGYPTVFPSGFDDGSAFEIPQAYLEIMKVPSSFYKSDYGDPNALAIVGEQRLMLPAGGNGFIGDVDIPADNLVERVVVFEDVFPKCALRVTSVTPTYGSIQDEYADGSKKKWDFVKYTITLKRITDEGDTEFPFKDEYLMPDSLQVKFLTPEEEVAYTDGSAHGNEREGYRLCGMTFNVQFKESAQTYTIEWNDTYGAQLPNTALMPVVGDPLILIGWNPKGMADLNIIQDAEDDLEEAGEQYALVLNDTPFSFQCAMMSGWAKDTGVLRFGQKVNVFHPSIQPNQEEIDIPFGSRHLRVLGYELKLDIPYDTPTYTVGESPAYSKLKALEEKLNATTREVSAMGSIQAGVISAPVSSGGGTVSDVSFGAETDRTVVLNVGSNSKELAKSTIISDASDVSKGVMKLYDSVSGQNIDGAPTQKSVNLALERKAERYNLRLKVQGNASGSNGVKDHTVKNVSVIIENYDAPLLDNTQYKFFLLRWRKGGWRAAAMSNSQNNDIADAGLDKWNILSRESLWMNGTPFSDLPLSTTQRANQSGYYFKSTHCSTLKVGCAIYKYTGNGTFGWQRVSNIAYVQLSAKQNGSYRFMVKQE